MKACKGVDNCGLILAKVTLSSQLLDETISDNIKL